MNDLKSDLLILKSEIATALGKFRLKNPKADVTLHHSQTPISRNFELWTVLDEVRIEGSEERFEV